MILFKSEMRDSILCGLTGEPLPKYAIALGVIPGKRVTRRMPKDMKCQWRVGSIHQARTAYFGEPFAWLLIEGVQREEFVGEISSAVEKEAAREGFDCWASLCAYLYEIHQKRVTDKPCYRIAFTAFLTREGAKRAEQVSP